MRLMICEVRVLAPGLVSLHFAASSAKLLGCTLLILTALPDFG